MLTSWLRNQTIRLTQLQPSEPGRYQGHVSGISYSFAVSRHGKGNGIDAIPMFSPAPRPATVHRLMSSIVNYDPGTLNTSSKGTIIPRFTPPSPETRWQQGEP